MARCGCVAGCSCLIQADNTLTDCVDLFVSGTGTAADPYLVSADAVVDPNAGNILTCEATGLRADISIDDTDDCIVLSGNGTPGSPLAVSLVFDPDTDSCISCGTGGIVLTFDPATSTCLNCGPSGIRLIIDPDVNNILECGASGLLVDGSAIITTHDGAGLRSTYTDLSALDPTASGIDSIGIGASAVASGNQSIAFGAGDDATSAPAASAQGAIAIGGSDPATAGAKAIAIGAIAIGAGTAAAAGAVANGVGCIALGANSLSGDVADTDAVSIGHFTRVTTGSSGGIAIGGAPDTTRAASCDSNYGIAIGVSDTGGLAGARVTAGHGIAIGSGNGVAGATAGQNAIAMGGGSSAVAVGIALGLQASAGQNYSLAVGRFAATTVGTQSIAIGGSDTAAHAASASAAGATAIGSTGSGTNGAKASGASSIAIGGAVSTNGAAASATDSIAIGRLTIAAHTGAIALGNAVSSTNTNQLNIGTKNIFVGAPNAITADADLIANQLTFYIDETGDTLTIKVKYSGGTVKTFQGALV